MSGLSAHNISKIRAENVSTFETILQGEIERLTEEALASREISEAATKLRIKVDTLRQNAPSTEFVRTSTGSELERMLRIIEAATDAGASVSPRRTTVSEHAPSRIPYLLGAIMTLVYVAGLLGARAASTGNLPWGSFSNVVGMVSISLVAGVLVALMHWTLDGFLDFLEACIVGGAASLTIIGAIVLWTYNPNWPLALWLRVGIAIVVILVLGIVVLVWYVLGIDSLDGVVARRANAGGMIISFAIAPWAILPGLQWANKGTITEVVPAWFWILSSFCLLAASPIGWLLIRRLRAVERTLIKQALQARPLSLDWYSRNDRIGTYSDRRDQDSQLESAFDNWLTAARDKAILPGLRSTINKISMPSPSVILEVHEAPGLRSISAGEYLVSTNTFSRFASMLAGISGGAIGVAGPRGVGKSTILEAVASGQLKFGTRLPDLIIRESVPVKYEAREFVLHLYARTCSEFLASAGPASQPRTVGSPQQWAACAAIAGGATCLYSITIGVPLWTVVTAALWISFAIGLLLLGRSFYRSFVASRQNAFWKTPADSLESARNSASRRLTEIRFQQRFSTGWSGKLLIPATGDISTTRTHELSRVVRSYPEIVHDFRGFLEEIIDVLRQAPDEDEVRVLFVIDELDKISSWRDAELFVNEIKSIFILSEPGCLYLVSVSEEALSSFEQEGVVVRDAFNSAFDEIVRVGYLGISDSQKLLRSRVIGMPIPFELLCHCMSGGLPRELIRIARSVAAHATATSGLSLEKMTRTCVEEDIREKLLGLQAALRDVEDQSSAARLMKATYNLVRAGCRYDSVVSAIADIGTGDSWGASKVGRVRLALVAHLYLCVTILDFFKDNLKKEDISAAAGYIGEDAHDMVADFDPYGDLDVTPTEHPESVDLDHVVLEDRLSELQLVDSLSIDQLASARVQIGFNPEWAWNTIESFRERWGWSTLFTYPG